MTPTFPRILALIVLACLANASRAEDQAVPIPGKAEGIRSESNDGSEKPRRWWFPFSKKARINRIRETQANKPHAPPAIINGVVLTCLLGGGLGLWLVLVLIRLRMQRGRMKRQARETSAFFGALLGFPAGLWIYDQLGRYSASNNEPEA